MWQVPFPQYWTVIQVLFWCGWFNLVVGTFNALPAGAAGRGVYPPGRG